MAAPASALQFAANQANAQLSTGPRTPAGKLASSANARSHGLTTRHALLPSEDLDAYQLHHKTHQGFYRPQGPIDHELVTELADLKWRLRRVPIFEAQLLNVEFLNLTTDPELQPHIKNLDSDAQILAVAFTRLVQSRVLPNLLNLEARLARRVDKIHTHLIAVEANRAPYRRPPPLPKDAQFENQEIEANPHQPIRVAHQAGRNEPCPCASGLKFKRCCLNKSASKPASIPPASARI